MTAPRSLPLPDAVETAAFAAAVGEDLLVLVNRPYEGVAEQLRVRPSGEVVELPALPLVAAGAAACGGALVVTGADPDGIPLALGGAADGRIAWSLALPGPPPTRWPIPGCAPGPVLAWQTGRAALEVAEVGPGGVGGARSVPVGGPPLDVSLGGGAAWAAWPERDGVRLAVLYGGEVRALHLPAGSPSHAAVGALDAGGAVVAWAERRGTFLARVGPGGESAAPVELDPGPAAGGRLTVVPGPEPLAWVQRMEAGEVGEGTEWTSALLLPGRAPVLVHEPVFAVAWWGRRIAVVCTGEVRLFDLEGR